MDDKDRIYEYFDKNLKPEDESKLFENMGRDEALRDEFNTTLHINNAISEFRKNSAPPIELSSAIMSSLGYSAAVSLSKPLWKSIISYSSAIGIAVGAALVIINNIYSDIQTKGGGASLSRASKTPAPVEINSDSSPISDSNRHESEVGNYIKKNESIQNEALNKNVAERFIENKKGYADENIECATLEESRLKLTQKIEIIPLEPNSLSRYELSETNNELKRFIKDFSVEYSYFLSWNLPKESIKPKQFSKFNNMQLSLFYDISDNFKIGANVRQETFFSKYSENDELGKSVKVEMQPNITSFGVSARLELAGLFGVEFAPQLSYNFSSYGQILRPGLVLQYSLNDCLTINSIFEYSYFQFTRQNTEYNAKKTSLSFGLNYHL
jgi:hypothetical protein